MELVEGRTCHRCGKVTARVAVFCHHCGVRQASDPSGGLGSAPPLAESVALSLSKVLILGFLALVCIFFALVGTCGLTCIGSGKPDGLTAGLPMLVIGYGLSLGCLALMGRVARMR